MRWFEFLVFLQSLPEPFKITDISEKLDMDAGQVSIRLTRLRLFSYVRYHDQKRKGRDGYELTDRGRRYKIGKTDETGE